MERDLTERLGRAGWLASRWSNGPDYRYGVHSHDYDKVLVVARGSIVFGLPARGERISLEAGERLDLPAGTDHDALVGPDGVTCLEAHAAAGTLGEGPRPRGVNW